KLLSRNMTRARFQQFFQAPRSRHGRKPQRSRPTSPLLLEQLEVRLTPSQFTPPYPLTSGSPLQKTGFNESEVLRYLQVGNTPGVGTTFQVFYNDEHALALGVSAVTVKTASGTTSTTSYASNTATYPGSPPAGGLNTLNNKNTGGPYYTPSAL